MKSLINNPAITSLAAIEPNKYKYAHRYLNLNIVTFSLINVLIVLNPPSNPIGMAFFTNS